MTDHALIDQVVTEAIRRYFAARHARVAWFVDRHFGVAGTLRLHRAALGPDVLRAPANLALAAPHAALQATAMLARRFRANIRPRSLLLHTDVGRELEWLICTELLELPVRHGGRESTRDALAETVLADPRLARISQATRIDDPAFRARLTQALAQYAGTRAAAAEVATSLATAGSGALVLKQLTPGAITLGPALAASVAQHAAITAFPLGAGLGGLWYGFFPAAPSALMVTGLTGGLMVGAACFAAFAGILTDPLQRRLGLHTRRLHRMLDALERQMLDPAAPGYVVHDHYAARLMDLLDLLGSAYRLAHG